jgi:type VI secretion system protein ImpF
MTGDSPLTVIERLLHRKSSVVEPGAEIGDPLRASILRDVEMLLNSRRPEKLIPEEYSEVAKSILNFGVPEFDQFGNLAAPSEQARLCKAFETAIQLFEPRLRNVKVSMIQPKKREGILRFRIEAVIGAMSEDLIFEAGVNRTSSEVSVSAGGGG